MIEGDKLYIVVRSDLEPGPLLAQSVHAAVEFCVQHPKLTKEWHDTSNFVCCLAVENETQLTELMHRAEHKRIPYAAFREDWLDNSLTAVAFHPTGKSLMKGLPLAFASIAQQQSGPF